MTLPHLHIKNSNQCSIGIEGRGKTSIAIHLFLFDITLIISEECDFKDNEYYSFELLPLKLGFTCFFGDAITVSFSFIDFIFGYTDWHFIREYELKHLETDKKRRYIASKGLLYKCPNRLFPILKRLPWFGKTGYELKTYNRLINQEVTLYSYSFKEVEKMVNNSQMMKADDYMRCRR